MTTSLAVYCGSRSGSDPAHADLARRLLQHPADGIEQVRFQLELVQRVGDVVGDRKGPPMAQHVDAPRAGKLLCSSGEVCRRHLLVQLLERRDAVGDELGEHAARAGALLAGAKGLDALAVVAQPGVVVRALHQPAAEHALQLGEAVVAERLREAHHGGRLHPGAARELRHRVERHVLRMLEREGGDALQLGRQAGVQARELALQLVVVVRAGGGGSH